MLHLVRVLAGCTDGPCPRVIETTDNDLLAVQGRRPSPEELAAMGCPDHETVVLVPRTLLAEYAASLR